MDGDKPEPFSMLTDPLEDKFCDRCFEFLTTYPDIDTLLATWDTADFTEEWNGTRCVSYEYHTTLWGLNPRNCELCKIFFDVQHDYSRQGCFGVGSGRGDWSRPRTFEAVYCFKKGAKPLDFHQIRFREVIDHGLRPQSSLWLEICAYPDGPAARFISARPTMSDLWSAEHSLLARGWIEDCLSTHKECRKNAHCKLPTRVIDVSSSSAPDTIRLYTSATDESVPYATLSYCWGTSSQPVLLKKGTKAELLDGIPTSKLPQTIVDAIHVTRELGLKYIWVDVLCVIQDSNEDKAKEINQMARIYQQAYVTIAAANAKAVGQGFIQAKIDCMQNGRWYRLPFQNTGIIYGSSYGGSPVYVPESEPINKRGWTLQENVLSPRVLTFDSYRLRWECKRHRCTDNRAMREQLESSNTPLMKRIQFADDQDYGLLSEEKRMSILQEWRELLELYSRRQLTDPGDKLPAISAIAQQFAIPLGGRYVAGLWANFLIRDLLWQVKERCELDRLGASMKTRKPSWSWISTDHAICNEGLHDGDIPAEVLECSATLDSEESPFGKTTGGVLVIRGLLAPATPDNRERLSQGSRHLDRAEDEREDRDWSQTYFLHLSRWYHTQDGHQDVARGLILESQADGRFRRIGVFRLWSWSTKEWFKDEKQATISII